MNVLSNGILFYAYNNEHINYAEIANINAMLIKRHMKNNNISVITDDNTAPQLEPSLFDQIIIKTTTEHNKRTFIYSDYNETVTWKNTTRDSAYELSPYDKTLLLDVDYLIFNDYYDSVFDLYQNHRDLNHQLDFAFSTAAYDIFHNHYIEHYVGKIPMLWATVIMFAKTPVAEQYFSYMEYIRKNYKYFSKLYGFNPRNFRNDYSLTIADKELYTWTNKHMFELPRIETFTLDAKILNFNRNQWMYARTSKYFETVIGHTNGNSVHMMNKHIILEYKEQIKYYYAES